MNFQSTNTEKTSSQDGAASRSRILLINPNTSASTTRAMLRIAADALGEGFDLEGVTARHGVPMIVNARELEASAAEVLARWAAAGSGWHGVMLACFGDPGLAALRAVCGVPVVGICEAAMQEAASGGRRFAVATTTPDLADAITARAAAVGLSAQFAGVRVTPGDPHALVADAAALERAMSAAVADCIGRDGAQAVIVGGGPLGQVAEAIGGRFAVPVIAPIGAAARRLRSRIAAASAASPASSPC